MMEANRAARTATNTPSRSFLKGRLFTDDDRFFSPSHANKKGKRYRYYQTGKDKDARVVRLPAPRIEEHVVTELRRLFQDPARVMAEIEKVGIKPDAARVLLETTALAARLGSPFEEEAHELARALILGVTIGEDDIKIDICPAALNKAVTRKEIAEATLTAPIRLISHSTIRRTRQGVKSITPPREQLQTTATDAALKAIRQAHLWLGLLTSGKAASFAEIARQESADTRFVARTIRLAFLAPEIVDQVLASEGTTILEVEKIRRGPELPLRWRDQERLLR